MSELGLFKGKKESTLEGKNEKCLRSNPSTFKLNDPNKSLESTLTLI